MSPTTRAVMLLMLGMLSIQLGASLAKTLFASLSPAQVTMFRLLLAAAMLAVMFRPWRTPVANFKLIVTYGLALGSMNFFYYAAIQRIPIGIAIAIEFLGPLGVALMSSKRPLDAVWAVLAGLGIVLILPKGSSSGGLDVLGVLYAGLAAMCWAIYIVWGKKASQQMKSGQVVAWGMMVAALGVLPLGVSGFGQLTWQLVPWVLAVALFSSAIPYTLEMKAFQHLPAYLVGVLASLEPVLGAFFGWLILHEYLNLTQWLAVLLIVGASMGSTFSHRPSSEIGSKTSI